MTWNDIEAKWATMTRRVQSGPFRAEQDPEGTPAPDPSPSQRETERARAPVAPDRPAT